MYKKPYKVYVGSPRNANFVLVGVIHTNRGYTEFMYLGMEEDFPMMKDDLCRLKVNILEDFEPLVEELHQILKIIDVSSFNIFDPPYDPELNARFSKIEKYENMLKIKYSEIGIVPHVLVKDPARMVVYTKDRAPNWIYQTK